MKIGISGKVGIGFLILLLSCTSHDLTVGINRTGTWQGVLTLDNNPGCLGQFELFLDQEGSQVTGYIDLKQRSTEESIPYILQRVDITGTLINNRLAISYQGGGHFIALNAVFKNDTFSGTLYQENGFIGCGSTSAADQNDSGIWSAIKK